MFKNQKKLHIGIFITIILAVFIIFIILSLGKNNEKITTPDPLLHKEVAQINPPKRSTEIPPLLSQGGVRGGNSATLLVGDITDYLSFAPNTVLYDALMQEKNAGKIEFSGRNYLGLGFFVTDIGTLHTGNGKNLIYYINGKEATIGVSSYILKNKDIIEWKLE